MSAIVWWVIPILATLIAAVLMVRRSRPRPPADTKDAIESYDRFREAMSRPTPRPVDEARTDRARRDPDGDPDA